MDNKDNDIDVKSGIILKSALHKVMDLLYFGIAGYGVAHVFLNKPLVALKALLLTLIVNIITRIIRADIVYDLENRLIDEDDEESIKVIDAKDIPDELKEVFDDNLNKLLEELEFDEDKEESSQEEDNE